MINNSHFIFYFNNNSPVRTSSRIKKGNRSNFRNDLHLHFCLLENGFCIPSYLANFTLKWLSLLQFCLDHSNLDCRDSGFRSCLKTQIYQKLIFIKITN